MQSMRILKMGFCLLFFSSVMSWGYFPPSFYMVQKNTAFHLKKKTVFFPVRIQEGSWIWEGSLWVDGLSRKWILKEKQSSQKWKTYLKIQPQAPSQAMLPVLWALFFEIDPHQVSQTWIQQGIPIALKPETTEDEEPLFGSQLAEKISLEKKGPELFVWKIGILPAVFFIKDQFLPYAYKKEGETFLFDQSSIARFGLPKTIFFQSAESTWEMEFGAVRTFSRKRFQAIFSQISDQTISQKIQKFFKDLLPKLPILSN